MESRQQKRRRVTILPTGNDGAIRMATGAVQEQSEQPEYAEWRSISERKFLDQLEQSTQNGPVTGQRKYGNYTYYQPQRDPNQPQDHRKPGGTGKKVLVTLGLAVLFGVVAGGIVIGSSMIAFKEIKNGQKTEYQLPTTELPHQGNADGDSNSAAESGSDATEEVSAGTTENTPPRR